MEDRDRVRWGLGVAAFSPVAWLLAAAIVRSESSTNVVAEGGALLMIGFAPVLAGVGLSMALDTASHPLVHRWLSRAVIVAGCVAAPFTWMAGSAPGT